MVKEKYFEDFTIGEKVTTMSITVTEAHVVNWGHLTMDLWPLHMDEEYGKKSVFKSRVAHGPLIFAMAIGMVYITGIYGNSILAWLGLENMKLPLPVRMGDTIHVNAEVIEKRETKNPSRGITKFRWEVINQKDETVMTLDYILMMHRRPV